MAEYSQKCHNGTSRGRSTETSDRLAAIQAQLDNLGREIKKVNENFYVASSWIGALHQGNYPQKEKDAAEELKEHSIKTLEFNRANETRYLQKRCFGSLHSSTDYNTERPSQVNFQPHLKLFKSIRRIGILTNAVSVDEWYTIITKARQTNRGSFSSRLDNLYL
ncbi:hypothetical protein Tco_1109811 [Tanacetum coccineum]|uniref:Uncharacterized protein n=1 Tax=Tanacetum coccineum TaxID=301880 RepID=A0ABQ5IJG4_9ASTR